MLRGWALAEQGQMEEGIAQLRQGVAGWRATGAEASTPYFLALLAETYGKGGQAGEGLTILEEALALVDKNEERYYEAELYRLKGELLLDAERKMRHAKRRTRKAKVRHPSVEVESNEFLAQRQDLEKGRS